MEKREVILVRHGQSTLNKLKVFAGRQDVRLTEEGIAQIKRSAEFLSSRYNHVDFIFSSPLLRAKATAELLNERFNSSVLIDSRLVETDFGRWEGKSPDELAHMKEWESYKMDPFHFNFPDGESPQDVKSRVLDFKREVISDKRWTRIIIVSHYTPIVFYILDVLNCSDSMRAAFKLTHGGVSVVEYREQYEYIGMLNFLP